MSAAPLLGVVIEGKVLFWVAVGLIAVIGQIREAIKKSKEAAQAPPPMPRNSEPYTPLPQPGAESEQEKLRRFLEALGVPQAPQPVPPIAAPVRNIVPRVKRQPRVQRPVVPVVPVEPEPMESRDPGRLEEPAQAMEQIARDYEVMSRTAPTAAPDVVVPERRIVELDLRSAFRSPENLRTAFLLREVLGPPRSEAV